MERVVVHGVRVRRAHAKVRVVGAPDRPGTAARVLRALADIDIEPGAMAHHATGVSGRRDITLTVAAHLGELAVATIDAVRDRLGAETTVLEGRLAEVALIGAGMRTDPIVAATFCEALAMAGIRLEFVAIEANQISVLCPESRLADAVPAVCEAFEVGIVENARPPLGVGGRR